MKVNKTQRIKSKTYAIKPSFISINFIFFYFFQERVDFWMIFCYTVKGLAVLLNKRIASVAQLVAQRIRNA